jgi:hypothetical protein
MSVVSIMCMVIVSVTWNCLKLMCVRLGIVVDLNFAPAPISRCNDDYDDDDGGYGDERGRVQGSY